MCRAPFQWHRQALTGVPYATLAYLWVAFFSLAFPAQAAYPEKPIKIIVAFTPGSSTDIVARLLGEQLSSLLGQSVILENRPGAAGDIATVGVMNAPADGCTLLMHSVAFSVNPTLFANAG
jgi:tripartite-type tricarboxylate transporter receptor subunit TctC